MLGNVEVLEFRFLDVKDEADINTYSDEYAWSRPYEYNLASKFLDNQLKVGSSIHNSAWGFEGVHIDFRNTLDKKYRCTHSDIVKNKYNLETYYYNLFNRDPKLIENFDCVLNISVLEHLPGGFNSTEMVLENLLEQAKVGGLLLCTFDYPIVNLKKLESLLGCKCIDAENRLSGANSVVKNNTYENLNIVFLALRRLS